MITDAVSALAERLLTWVEAHPRWPALEQADGAARTALLAARAALADGDGLAALEAAAGLGARLHAATRP